MLEPIELGWLVLALVPLASAVGTLFVVSRISRLARVLGLKSFGGGRKEMVAVVDELIARIKAQAAPDGRVHTHDVEVLARKIVGGRKERV